MAFKIVYVTTNPDKVSDDAQIISRKALNALMEEGWEITAEDEDPKDIEVIKTKLERSENVVAMREKTGTLSVAGGPDRGTEAVGAAFGTGEGPEPANQLIGALEGISRAVSAGGSHLGGGVTRCIPGVGIVSAQEVGMARDSGVHAGMMGWPESECPFPHDSRPWHLWMEGYKQASRQLDEAALDDPDTYTAEQQYAYKQGGEAFLDAEADEAQALKEGMKDYKAEVLCPYKGGPSYLAWLRGFADAGGEIEAD